MKWIKYIIIINLFLYDCFANDELIDPMIAITPSTLNPPQNKDGIIIVDQQNKDELILSAIAISSEGEFYCIINNIILIENDKIKGFTIDKITTNTVIMIDENNNTKELTIY